MAASSAPSPTGFSLYDLLTRVTPGVFLLTILLVVTVDIETLLSITPSPFVSVLIVVTGFIIGELIDSVRVAWFAAPRPFRMRLYKEWHREGKVSGVRDRLSQKFILPAGDPLTRYEDPVLPMLYRRFKISTDLRDSNEVYLRLYTEFDSELNPLARRYQTTTIFLQNLRIAIVIAMFFTAFLAISETGVSNEGSLALLVVLVMFGAFLSQLNGVENAYVWLLLLALDVTEPKTTSTSDGQRQLNEFP